MTSLKDGDLQHSSVGPICKGDIEPQPSSQKLIRNRTASWARSDGRSRRYVQYRADQSQTETIIASPQIIVIIYMWTEVLISIEFLNTGGWEFAYYYYYHY